MAAPEGFTDTAVLASDWWTPPWVTGADPDGNCERSVNIFVFPGTVPGYGSSNTRGMNLTPFDTNGEFDENKLETSDRGVGDRYCCGGGVLVHDSGT